MTEFYIPNTANLSDDYFVYTGTIYGEIRGGTTAAQQNVAQVILNRHVAALARDSAATIRDVCLAPRQFSCWNDDDVNRKGILTAFTRDPKTWATCAHIAWDALNNQNVDRIGGARNYYATWMKLAPPWAKPPAVVTLNDGFHIFVRI